MSEKVELHPAHMWDCPECGRENFCRSIVYHPEPGETMRDVVAHVLGVEPFEVPDDMAENSFWMTAPDKVTCAHCGEAFETEDQMEDWEAN